MSQEIQNLIARHAFIRAGIQRDVNAGRQTPPQILNELQRIESKASATLSPSELLAAREASEVYQARFIQQHDFDAAQSDAAARHYALDQTAKEMTGMTLDQVQYAAQGKPIPTKGRGFKPGNIKQGVTDMIAKAGLGKNVKYEQFLKMADRVQEIEAHGKDPKSYLAKHFGADKAPALLDMANGFNASGVGVAVGLVNDDDNPDYLRQPTESDQMRAQLANSWAASAQNDRGSSESIAKRYDSAYLGDENLTGDVARAMLDVETQAEIDPGTYDAPDYEIEENADVRF
ncbi:hypothetical protein EYC87_05285 [Halieaceae bacterium IMCC8485]|uniref:Uncharacterized protein n=1 Tax=Candidatus Seongchinamella marina TaxID=2518990 RepID=A0ABT3SSN6_9GAMM|nr:hypothetical protein [Candidatus Seongchinamella marina]MCX2972997.1 hypothetical protein [Candidatus Seongchinamella marina]